MLELRADRITKRFDRRTVFHDVSFSIQSSAITGTITGTVLGITGRNGAGKSTLVKILAGVLSPTSGSVSCLQDGKVIDPSLLPQRVGFVAPYLMLYEEFTPLELMRLVTEMRGTKYGSAMEQKTEELLRSVRLWERRVDDIRSFSSGMKQRMKYALALLHSPSILIFDEPMTNLDSEGIAVVEAIINKHITAQGSTGEGLVVLATNDARDLALCHQTIAVGAAA